MISRSFTLALSGRENEGRGNSKITKTCEEKDERIK